MTIRIRSTVLHEKARQFLYLVITIKKLLNQKHVLSSENCGPKELKYGSNKDAKTKEK